MTQFLLSSKPILFCPPLPLKQPLSRSIDFLGNISPDFIMEGAFCFLRASVYY